MTLQKAKELLNESFKKINCSCNDKGLCSHSSNPFALEEAINKIFDDFEKEKEKLKREWYTKGSNDCHNAMVQSGVIKQ